MLDVQNNLHLKTYAKGVLETFVYVMQMLQNTKASLRRFRQMLFGARTENKRNVLKQNTGNDAGNDNRADAAPGDQGVLPAQDRPSELQGKRPGHGRNGVQAYGGATVVPVEHPSLKSGDPCSECPTGKVYAHEPREFVQVVGQPPLAATIYQIERLRCRLCDAIFSAPLPEEVGPQKYDESAASMIALLRYGSGMPFFRLEGLQASLRVPLPDATQWDIVGKAVKGPRSVYEELIRQAAQAELLHNDDTPARILALMAERTKAEARGEEPEAKAINTSGIVALLQQRKVVLFFTGHRHAGQNLAEVLAHRAKELDAPIQMCDGLSSNITKQFKTILCNCISHYLECRFIKGNRVRRPCARRCAPTNGLNITFAGASMLIDASGSSLADPSAYAVECREVRRRP